MNSNTPDSPFTVGEWIIHANHGVGRISEITTLEAAGYTVPCIRVWFEYNKLNLDIPITKNGVRNVDKIPYDPKGSNFDEVVRIITQEPKKDTRIWHQREKDLLAKQNSLSVSAWAEVVRDLYTNDGKLNFSAGKILNETCRRLFTTLALMQDTTISAVVAKINVRCAVVGREFKDPTQSIQGNLLKGVVPDPLSAERHISSKSISVTSVEEERWNQQRDRKPRVSPSITRPVQTNERFTLPKISVTTDQKVKTTTKRRQKQKPLSSPSNMIVVPPESSKPALKPNEDTQATIGGVGVVKSQADSIALVTDKDATIERLRQLLESTVREQDKLRQLIMKPSVALDENTQAEIRHLQWVVEERGEALKRQADINNRLIQQNLELTEKIKGLEEELKRK